MSKVALLKTTNITPSLPFSMEILRAVILFLSLQCVAQLFKVVFGSEAQQFSV